MQDRMFWIDLETEGFNPLSDNLLEVGVVITDLQLNVIADASWAVLPYVTWRPVHLLRKNTFVYDMHESSGLLDFVNEHGLSPVQVDRELNEWAVSLGMGMDKKDPICGSSVHFDRKFMDVYLRQTHSGFSHRIIDVSSEKETIRRYHPEWLTEWKDATAEVPKAHRAIDDIMQSIAEFRFYRTKRGDL